MSRYTAYRIILDVDIQISNVRTGDLIDCLNLIEKQLKRWPGKDNYILLVFYHEFNLTYFLLTKPSKIQQ